jgi:exoribonuclease R
MTRPVSPLRAAAVAAMRQNGFAPEFSPEIMREVASIVEPSGTDATHDRRDLRALLWSSIDNRQSLDLDQIEVAERNPDDSITVRIAVADVESLVARGSHADIQAAANATSVYTGVAVFPMLPERLSTDLTSLNESEDRLAVVIGFTVGVDGTLSDQTVTRGLVRNQAKLAYDDIGAWLDGDAAPPRPVAENAALREQLLLQDEAAQRLRRARALAGALNFESVEASPVVVNGKVVDLAVARRNRARDLIEDFMVAANRAVAIYLIDHGSASLRRVVREPKRWDRIVALAAEVGERLPDAPNSKALADFLDRRRAADPDHFADLSLSVVKLLGPGVYVLERRLGDRRGAGHFGLAVADYVHSTAPNRRFADLVTQRMLRAADSHTEAPYTDAELIAIATHCTERGEAARKVERTMRKVAGASMLAERIGEDFTAIVTAASPKGVYARLLSPPVEGRIVRGAQGLDVGDTVRLTLVVADAVRGYIDFAHADDAMSRKRERRRRKKTAADQLRPLIGQTFDAIVTGVSASGTWVRLADGSAEGRVVTGFKPLTVGMAVPVTLTDTDSVHGFIDFSYAAGVEPSKLERLARKRAAALTLSDRIGESFHAVVTGTSQKATWLRLADSEIEGRLVRGRGGLSTGDAVDVVLLTADPVRGFIDFARIDPV